MHIRDYIAKYRDEIGLVGNYELGDLEENPSEYSDRVSYRKKVYGYLRKNDGTAGTVRQHLMASRDSSGRRESEGKFSTEAYKITNHLLKEIGKEVLKIYYPTNDPNSLDCDFFNFVGGEGGSGRFKRAAIPIEYYSNSGAGNKHY